MEKKVHDHKNDAVPYVVTLDGDGSLIGDWKNTKFGDRFYEWGGSGLVAEVCYSFFSGKWIVHLWRKVGENAYDWVKIPLDGVTSYDSCVDAEAAALVFGEKALKHFVF
jgi:hypothetical protein